MTAGNSCSKLAKNATAPRDMQPVVHVERGPTGHLLARVVSRQVNTEFLPLDQVPTWVLDMARDARIDGSRLVDSEVLLDLASGRLCGKRKAHLLITLRDAGANSKFGVSSSSTPPHTPFPGDSDILQGCNALLALRGNCTVGPRPGGPPAASKARGSLTTKFKLDSLLHNLTCFSVPMQTTDGLGLSDSDYDSFMEKARAVCIQQFASERLKTTTALQQLCTATAELQTALQSLGSLQSKGLLGAATCETATQEITDKIVSNQKQKSLLDQTLASLQDAQELDDQAITLIRDSVVTGCSKARKRRRT